VEQRPSFSNRRDLGFRVAQVDAARTADTDEWFRSNEPATFATGPYFEEESNA
jgi:hypothetical protein